MARSLRRHPKQRNDHPAPDHHDNGSSPRALLESLHFPSPRLTAQAVKTFWRSALPLESIQSSKGTPLIASSRFASSREGRLCPQNMLAKVAGLTPNHSATLYCRIVSMILFIFYLKTSSKGKSAVYQKKSTPTGKIDVLRKIKKPNRANGRALRPRSHGPR